MSTSGVMLKGEEDVERKRREIKVDKGRGFKFDDCGVDVRWGGCCREDLEGVREFLRE